MDCDQPSTTEKEKCYLNIDFSNPENIFDFSVCYSKPTVRCPESQLILVIKPPPQRTTNYRTVQVIGGNDNDIQFECDLCRKTFGRLAHIRRHLLTHSGVKPYCCRVCNKRFLRSDYLLFHIRQHKKNEVHNCCVCGKTSKVWSDFITHCLTHDAFEYENIASKRKTLSSIKQSKSSTNKQDNLQKTAELPSKINTTKVLSLKQPIADKEEESLNNKSFYQSTIRSPVYPYNCKPLPDHPQCNTIPYSSVTQNVRYSPYHDLSLPHQPTITLYHQSQPLISQLSLQDNFDQPPDLIHIPPLVPITSSSLDYTTSIPDQCYTNNSITVSPMDYGSPEMMHYEELQSLLQSGDTMQPPILYHYNPYTSSTTC